MSPIKEAIEALEKIEQLTEHGPQQYARAALAALRAMPAEPVAWKWLKEHAEGIAYTLLEDGDKEASDTIHSLITAVTMAATPPTAPVPAEPVAQAVTRREFHEYEGSAKQDTIGYLTTDIHWLKQPVEVGSLDLYATPPAAPAPLSDAERDDPLQGAVDWFLQAAGEFFCVATVQRTLRIGYNRAKRLCDVAKERATKGGKL